MIPVPLVATVRQHRQVRRRRPQQRHLGDVTDQSISAGISAGSAAASAAAVGASIATIAISGGIAAVGIALVAWLNRKRPGQKIAATEIVNELEPLLEENREAYLHSQRTPMDYEAALSHFDQAFAWLKSEAACGNVVLGPPGEWCIADRSRGGKHDWYRLYRDPIEDAPPVPVTPLEQSFAAFGFSLEKLRDPAATKWLYATAAALFLGVALKHSL